MRLIIRNVKFNIYISLPSLHLSSLAGIHAIIITDCITDTMWYITYHIAIIMYQPLVSALGICISPRACISPRTSGWYRSLGLIQILSGWYTGWYMHSYVISNTYRIQNQLIIVIPPCKSCGNCYTNVWSRFTISFTLENERI